MIVPFIMTFKSDACLSFINLVNHKPSLTAKNLKGRQQTVLHNPDQIIIDALMDIGETCFPFLPVHALQ